MLIQLPPNGWEGFKFFSPKYCIFYELLLEAPKWLGWNCIFVGLGDEGKAPPLWNTSLGTQMSGFYSHEQNVDKLNRTLSIGVWSFQMR